MDKNIKMIFSDIDGTLLPEPMSVPAGLEELMEDIQKAGIIMVPCSGRGVGNIPEYILKHSKYAIGVNGGQIWDCTAGKFIYEKQVEPALAERAIMFYRERTGCLYTYIRGKLYVDSVGFDSYVKEQTGVLFDWLESGCREDFLELVQKKHMHLDKIGFYIDDMELKKKYMKEIEDSEFAAEVTMVEASVWNIELNPKGVSKGAAAGWLADRLHIDPDNCLAAGDNYNDQTMIEFAGISAVPANAVDILKEKADYIVPSCEEKGIQNFIADILTK